MEPRRKGIEDAGVRSRGRERRLLRWGSMLLAPAGLASLGSAQQFGPGQVLAGETLRARCVQSADLDGDGDADVLSASYGDGVIAWFENEDGQGGFGLRRVIATDAEGALRVRAADLDGDGDQDVLSVGYSAGEIAWYENTDGRGTFGPPRVVSTAARPVWAFLADLDLDGDVDVLVGSQDDGDIAWHENLDGLGSFGPKQVIAAPASPYPYAADLDGDGDADLVSGSAPEGDLVWYENQGGGVFRPPHVVPMGRSLLCIADLDDDGDLDLIASTSILEFVWFENLDGQGDFGAQHPITIELGTVSSMYVADLDGDDDPDLVACSYLARSVAWLENTDGKGAFGPQQVITTSADGAEWVHADDLDGDGDADVLSASELDDKIAWYENQDGLGAFGPQQVLSAGAAGVRSVRAADLDGDGDLDVLAASKLDRTIGWYENQNGLGRFGQRRTIYDKEYGVEEAIAADLDGDGDLDVLAGGSTAAAWYENLDGLGGFGPRHAIATYSPRSVFAADLDGDGDLDVLLGQGNQAAWYENLDGLGTLGPEHVVSTEPDLVQSVLAADLDGDGDQDVLTASIGDGTVAWYENLDGLGTFGPQLVISDDLVDPWCVFAADLDGDGDQDVLSAWSGTSEHDAVAWYENTDGLGGFGPQQVLTTLADGAKSVFAADLDGDGDLDVVSGAIGYYVVAWYENLDGHGGFAPPKLVWNDSSSFDSAQNASVFAADLDGDGDREILAAISLADRIASFTNDVCCSLVADPDTVSLLAGGTQTLALDAGPLRAFDLYWVLTTSAGASPGLPLAPPPLKLPLNSSSLLLLTLTSPGLLVAHSLDFLDGAGQAAASTTLPAGLDPGLAGVVLHHAYVLLDPATLRFVGVSHAAALELVP